MWLLCTHFDQKKSWRGNFSIRKLWSNKALILQHSAQNFFHALFSFPRKILTFYCSHVLKLFYDNVNPINARTFQYRSMLICSCYLVFSVRACLTVWHAREFFFACFQAQNCKESTKFFYTIYWSRVQVTCHTFYNVLGGIFGDGAKKIRTWIWRILKFEL